MEISDFGVDLSTDPVLDYSDPHIWRAFLHRHHLQEWRMVEPPPAAFVRGMPYSKAKKYLRLWVYAPQHVRHDIAIGFMQGQVIADNERYALMESDEASRDMPLAPAK